TGTLALPLLQQTSGPPTVTFSPDDRFVAALGGFQEANVWDAATGQPVTVPLESSGGGSWWTSPGFSPDGRHLLCPGTSPDAAARISSLEPDPSPAPDLTALADLLSGGRIDATGGISPVPPDRLLAEWKTLSARDPERFQPSSDELLAWDRQESARCAG